MIAEGQTYNNLSVNIDGATYVKCKFNQCAIVFNGIMPFSFDQCDFIDCRWAFSGNALLTVRCMAGLYTQGGGGKELIEGIFNQIRGEAGTAPAAAAAKSDGKK